MNFKSSVEKLFDQLGTDVRLIIRGRIVDTRAVLQPMRYKNKMYLGIKRNEMGFSDSECFLYLGPAEPSFVGEELETTVWSDGASFNVSRADRVLIGNETVYIWAVLTPRIKDGAYEVMY